MGKFSVFYFTCCLDEKTMNSVFFLFNFIMLLFIQILIYSTKFQLKIKYHSIYHMALKSSILTYHWYLILHHIFISRIHTVILKGIPVVHQNEDLHLVMSYPRLKHTRVLSGRYDYTQVKGHRKKFPKLVKMLVLVTYCS